MKGQDNKDVSLFTVHSQVYRVHTYFINILNFQFNSLVLVMNPVMLHTKLFSSDIVKNPYPGILNIKGYICTVLQNKPLKKLS